MTLLAPSASVYGTCGARMRHLREGRVRGNEHGIRRVRPGACIGRELTGRLEAHGARIARGTSRGTVTARPLAS